LNDLTRVLSRSKKIRISQFFFAFSIDKRGEDVDNEAIKAWARAPVRRSDWDAMQEYGRVIKRRSPYYLSNPPVVESRDVDLRLPGSWRIM